MKIKMLKDDVEKEVDVAAIFETQEELDKVTKSANSLGKNEILKTLGVTSIEEAKAKMGDDNKVSDLTKELGTLKEQLKNEAHLRMANEIGVKPELAPDVIALAELNAKTEEDFKTVLEDKAKKLNAIANKENGNPKKAMGNPKSQEEMDLEKQDREETKRLSELDPQKK